MDKVSLALVTGGAHRLGRIFALTLARHGYSILLHYHRSAEAAIHTSKEIQDIGTKVYPVEADLTDSTQIQALFSKIDALNIPLKVLVNSAAIMKHDDLSRVSLEDWDTAIGLKPAPCHIFWHKELPNG